MPQGDISQFVHVPHEQRSHCLICGQKMSSPLIDLPDFPMTEIYTRSRVETRAGFLDQAFHLCSRCGHGQLANVIDMELQYGQSCSYFFRTAESATARSSAAFFIDFFDRVVGQKTFNRIVEVGANDLFLLKSLRSRADSLVGIDPVLAGREAELSEGNVTAVGGFFEDVDLAAGADIVICKDTLEHVADPLAFMKKIVDKGHADTMFFFQFPILDTLVALGHFDHIFHQHVNIFSLRSLEYLLQAVGCELMDHTINYQLWGSVLIAFRKKRQPERPLPPRQWAPCSGEAVRAGYALFKENLAVTRRYLQAAAGRTVYGYGAALMLPVLSYHLQDDLSGLACVLDDDERKDGLYYINLPVRVTASSSVPDMTDAVVLITAIAAVNNVRQILARVLTLNPHQILVPLSVI